MHLLWKGARVTDAGHATITCCGETKLVQVSVDTGRLKVLGDDTRAWGKGGPDIWLSLKSLFKSFFGEETCLEHDARIGRVCARGDGGDDDRTVAERVLLTVVLESSGGTKFALVDAISLEADRAGKALLEVSLHVVHVDLVMRALRSGKGWLDRGEVELHDIARVIRVGDGAVIDTVETLGLQILGDHLDAVSISADEVKILNSLIIYREESHSCTILWRHISDCSSVSQ